MATGLVCLELYKVLAGVKLEAFRNTFANLALPLFAMSEPMPPQKMKYNGMEWSLWDRWTLEGDPTVQQLLDHFSAKKLSCYSISCGQSLLYNSIFPKHRERLGRKVCVTWPGTTGRPPPSLILVGSCAQVLTCLTPSP